MPMNIDWGKLLEENAGDIIKGGIGLYGAKSAADAQNKSAQTNLALGRTDLELQADAQYQNQLKAQADIDLQRRELDSKTRDDAYRSAMLAGLTKNFKFPGRPEGVPQYIHEGITPEMMDAAEMRRTQAMDRLQNGQHFETMEAPKRLDIAALIAADDAKKEAEKKAEHHGNIFGKILKGAGMVSSFIPGVSSVVAPILTGAGGLVNGDGLKSSLLNAGMAAIPMGAGKLLKSAKAAKAAKIVQAATA